MTPPPLPPAFAARMASLLGAETDAFFASYDRPALTGLRANTLKLTAESFLALTPFALRPLPWLAAGFLASDDARPGRHPHHAAGLYYLQDPSAMLAAVLLDPQPGERILDLCAAPGGKTTHLAAALAGSGLLVANELVRSRTPALIENLERCGVQNHLVLSETAERLAAQWPAAFDRVLVDAPCSGEGMFRKTPAARREWRASSVTGCALRQQGILDAAAALVRPGGRLLYATCTFAPAENEGVIARFLRNRPDFALLPAPDLPGLAPGRGDWIEPALAADLPLERCVRVWPHHSPGEGHFYALLQRAGTATLDRPAGVAQRDRPVGVTQRGRPFNPDQSPDRGTLSREAAALLREFWQTTINPSCPQGPLPAGPWAQFGEWIHLLPASPETWQPFRPLTAGLRVGRLATARIEPAHALALSLPPAAVRHEVNVDAATAAAYLAGETLAHPGPDGWVRITVDGWGLGWGKRVAGVIKNHYPRRLRTS